MGELTAQKSMLAGPPAGKTGARSGCSRLSVECAFTCAVKYRVSNWTETSLSGLSAQKSMDGRKKRGCERSELPSYVFFEGILSNNFKLFNFCNFDSSIFVLKWIPYAD